MALTLDVLSYLHDARLLGVEVDFSTAVRSLTFTATYHDDCGLPSVAGKTVRVAAEDITLIQSRVHGAMTNPETIDSCDLSVSENTAAQLGKWLEMGGRDPKARLSLTTHSGSVWEIMCESLSVNILENRPTKEHMDCNLKSLADYVICLSESAAHTHHADDLPLYQTYLADAAVLLALAASGSGISQLQVPIEQHERLRAHAFLAGPEHAAIAESWQRFKMTSWQRFKRTI